MVKSASQKKTKAKAQEPEPVVEDEIVPVIPDANLEDLDTTRQSGRTVRIITGSYEHNLFCVALTMSPKGELFTPIFHFTPHTQSIRCLAWSRRFLVSGANDELIRLYDLQRRRELGTLMHHQGQILALEFYKSKWLLSGGSDGKVCIWRMKDWELLGELKGHKAPVVDLSIHHTGRVAISVAENKKVILWNLMTGRKASAQSLRDSPRKVSWVPNSNNYVIGFDRKIVLYKSSKPAFEMALESPLQHMEFYKVDGKDALFASYSNGKIDIFEFPEDIFDAPTPSHTLEGHSVRVKHFAFLDNLLASVSSDGKTVVWDLDTKDQIAVYSSSDRLNCVALVPDEVEKDVKRPLRDLGSDIDTEPEDNAPKPKKLKKKKAKVTVTEG